eukprot:gene25627-11284_t
MVFATLSSTGRQIFQRLTRGFDMVLIDEACQASEIAVLQPLVVLVGDPQQLPATIFSSVTKEMLLERSLFERLQKAGVPVKMLNVQYRMHPEIRQFPSAFFYDSQLQDGLSVLQTPPAAFYSAEVGVLKPYVFFDVASGVESTRARSRTNQAEADMAAGLFWELRCELIAAFEKFQKGEGPAPEQAVRDLIRETMVWLLGPTVAKEVKVETVDGFQGKQLDVVILSCVRSGGAGRSYSSIGFLADTRRLNVAITRAKRALWILGKASALQHNETWGALIKDAEERGVVIQDAVAEDLFERFAKQKQKALEEARSIRDFTPPPGPPPPPPPRQIGFGETSSHRQQQPQQQQQLPPTGRDPRARQASPAPINPRDPSPPVKQPQQQLPPTGRDPRARQASPAPVHLRDPSPPIKQQQPPAMSLDPRARQASPAPTDPRDPRHPSPPVRLPQQQLPPTGSPPARLQQELQGQQQQQRLSSTFRDPRAQSTTSSADAKDAQAQSAQGQEQSQHGPPRAPAMELHSSWNELGKLSPQQRQQAQHNAMRFGLGQAPPDHMHMQHGTAGLLRQGAAPPQSLMGPMRSQRHQQPTPQMLAMPPEYGSGTGPTFPNDRPAGPMGPMRSQHRLPPQHQSQPRQGGTQKPPYQFQ